MTETNQKTESQPSTKFRKIVTGGALVTLFAAVPMAAAAAINFDGWSVLGPGKLLGADKGALAVQYESPQFERILVQPPRPIPLPSGTSQVRFWCARIEGDFDLRILVRDASGAEHFADTLTSRPQFPAIRRSEMKYWSVWHQVESETLAATDRLENRIQPEFLRLAQRLDWPQPLSLAGIEIRPAKNQRDNEAFGERDTVRAGKGLLWLAELSAGATNGLQARFNWFLNGRWRWGWDIRPRLFLDDLTRRDGALRYAIELRKGYQGPLIWRHEGAGDLQRTNAPAILAGRIELPELPAGRYFIETKTWKSDGTLDRTETMELFVITGAERPLPAARAPLTWETGQPRHVFGSDTASARLTLKIANNAWPGRSSPAKCVVRVADWRGRLICQSEHAKAESLPVLCNGLREGTDYTATAEFREGNKLLDRVTLHFGVASRPRDAAGPLPTLPSRDALLMSRQPVAIAELYGSAFSGDRDETATDADLKEMDRWFESLPALGFKVASFMFGWGECEPLPGVVRWDEIEQRVAHAQRLGLQVFLTPTLWGNALEWPRWIEFQPMLDQFGYVMTPGRSGVVEPALADPIRRAGAHHWLRAVATRFRTNPTVIGYRTKPVNLPGENQPYASRPDYAPVTQRAFAEWLKTRDSSRKEMARLFLLPNQTPQRTGPDLSAGWQRFMEFRVHGYVESVRDILTAIRSVDPKRQIHIYRSSTPTACEAAIPLLTDGAEFHDEGGPFYFQRAVESMCLQAGIPYTNEGHQFTPPSLAMADAGFFYGSIFDRGWCWLYRWHARRHEDPRFAALPKVMEFVRESQPALREWVAAAGDSPDVLVFGSRADRLLGGMRTGFYSDIAGLDVFTALFSYHQLPAHFADEYTDWTDLRRFKCVFAVGDVMAERAIQRLASFARSGGKVVLVGDAGRFCHERPAERNLLRKQLDGIANVKFIAAPAKEPPPPGPAFRASPAFDDADLETILAWAGVSRPVRAETSGFECVRKRSATDPRVYVAVFRRYPGEYENIWYDAEVEKRWGRQPARVLLSGMSDGNWRVEKLHRTSRSLGVVRAENGRLSFNTEPALVGELQLFRLTKAD